MAIADPRILVHPLPLETYERMVETGLLGEDDRVELLDGVLSEMNPQGIGHAAAIQWLGAALGRAVDPQVGAVRVQLPLRLLPRSMPEPDLAVVPPGLYFDQHPEIALLVIEVSVSSLALDEGPKAALYAAAGIPELWVFDLQGRRVRVHRTPTATGYRERSVVTGGAVTPSFAGAPEIDIGALLALL